MLLTSASVVLLALVLGGILWHRHARGRSHEGDMVIALAVLALVCGVAVLVLGIAFG